MSSAKSYQNRRAGVETRPYKRGAESSPPTLKLHFYFLIGTVKTVPYNFSLFIFHYSSIFGSSSYGCAITPLSLRDISPNRGISPTPTHEIECVCPSNPNLYFKFIPRAYRKKPPKRRLLVWYTTVVLTLQASHYQVQQSNSIQQSLRYLSGDTPYSFLKAFENTSGSR